MTSTISNELLISLVQCEPAVLDKRTEVYRKNGAWLNAWKRIAQALGLIVSLENIDLIVRRWRNLRDTFAKKIKELAKKSGVGAGEPVSKWKYFDLKLFLRDIVEPRPTTSNLDVPNSLDEVLRDTEDDPAALFGSMLPHQDDMDSVPAHLRGQCKVHLLAVLLHYQAGVIPTTLSPAVRAALRDAETN
ncbi:uncharacterized protein [Dermacentor albipictus]|uniref:uncharacterized protein n=1 Tax=Dermacentor albipictus TaxID=60249 RepID=UPI0038FCA2A3